MRKKIYILIIFSLLTLSTSRFCDADSTPEGLWYGTFVFTEGINEGYSNQFAVDFAPLDYGYVSMVLPELDLIPDENDPFATWVPLISIDGTDITIGINGIAVLTGEIINNYILGSFESYLGNGEWSMDKYIVPDISLGEEPMPVCENLPSLYCVGDADYCGELVQFTPGTGDGYAVETYEAYRYIRRDLMMLIKYATAKTACKTADWDYGNKGPLGLLDMSEADGSTPKFADGSYRHPQGSHEFGQDIDTAYFQLFSPDNLARVVGLNWDNHLIEPPYNFDRYRTALYISYLAEHPFLRVVGVDGQIGPLLDGTDSSEGVFDELVNEGWIDSNLRASIPLAYEVEDTGKGWFRFHHHHLHVSMNSLYDIVSEVEIKPDTINKYSNGKSITVYIEFQPGIDAGQTYIDSVALILDGHSMLYAQPEDITISDYNENGITDLTIKFDRSEVIGAISNGNVEISIIGMNGVSIEGNIYNILFQDSDTVSVIGPPSSVRMNDKTAVPFSRPGGRMFWAE